MDGRWSGSGNLDISTPRHYSWKRTFERIEVLQSRRRPVLGPSPGWKQLLVQAFTFKPLLRYYTNRASRGLLDDCKIFANLRLKLYTPHCQAASPHHQWEMLNVFSIFYDWHVVKWWNKYKTKQKRWCKEYRGGCKRTDRHTNPAKYVLLSRHKYVWKYHWENLLTSKKLLTYSSGGPKYHHLTQYWAMAMTISVGTRLVEVVSSLSSSWTLFLHFSSSSCRSMQSYSPLQTSTW